VDAVDECSVDQHIGGLRRRCGFDAQSYQTDRIEPQLAKYRKNIE
jgi:hypothetical protein